MGIHDGHRSRVKSRILEEGMDGFSEHEVLEFILFYAIPRVNVNELAHRLINKFGSIAGAMRASKSDLMGVDGMTENAAVLFMALPDIFRRYQLSMRDCGGDLSSSEKAAAYLLPMFTGIDYEIVVVLLLDARGRLLACKKIDSGTISGTGVSTRKIVEYVVEYKATNVILAHNHPSGVALPSNEDQATTISLRKSLSDIEVKLLDHIVIADEDYVSMAESGLFRSY